VWWVQGQAKLIMISRIGGICAGVFLTLAIAVTILPNTAHGEIMTGIAKALDGLLDLDQLSWMHTQGIAPSVALVESASTRDPAELADECMVKVRFCLDLPCDGTRDKTPAMQSRLYIRMRDIYTYAGSRCPADAVAGCTPQVTKVPVSTLQVGLQPRQQLQHHICLAQFRTCTL
jgi:hypothetical protein